jgi:hypothetical protein
MYRSLNPALLLETVEQLRNRVAERFPGSGLSKVAEELMQISRDSVDRAGKISQPHLALRMAVGFILVLIAVVLSTALGELRLPAGFNSLAELIQVLESGLNEIVLLGAAVFFLVTLETRIKRRRALKAIHELRSLAWIIDMHQLTKDPQHILNAGPATESSPERTMTNFELSRYLDYCSEMLSLIGKIGALYVQRFDDPVALTAVDQLEDLTTGLSRKIWQKIMMINETKS